ncbi:hypothetical protein DFR75_1011126 [Nocardia ignorata]|uniref:Uncharacterized protein n=1 Tax=Nocardia ignorata TaxID=145285 RepID=A0A4R6PV91_NOCIG|nr:hypothetical protein DFR75_1011126 [Nocardia ignorata]
MSLAELVHKWSGVPESQQKQVRGLEPLTPT